MTAAIKPKTKIDPRDYCSRCHGTGREPDQKPLTPAQSEILDQLHEVGIALRKVSNSRTQEGLDARRVANTQLRVLADQARNLGLAKPRIAGAAGLSKQGLHNILTHVTTV